MGQMTEKREERIAAHFAWDGRAKVALLQWYPFEMGGILGGFRENVPARPRKRCDRYWALLRVGCLKWQR